MPNRTDRGSIYLKLTNEAVLETAGLAAAERRKEAMPSCSTRKYSNI